MCLLVRPPPQRQAGRQAGLQARADRSPGRRHATPDPVHRGRVAIFLSGSPASPRESLGHVADDDDGQLNFRLASGHAPPRPGRWLTCSRPGPRRALMEWALTRPLSLAYGQLWAKKAYLA